MRFRIRPQHGIAEAETIGHVVLRMSEADVLPLQFSGFADTITEYVDELHKLTEEKRKNSEELGKLLDQNVFALAADPTRVVLPPEREPVVPYLNFAPLDNGRGFPPEGECQGLHAVYANSKRAMKFTSANARRS